MRQDCTEAFEAHHVHRQVSQGTVEYRVALRLFPRLFGERLARRVARYGDAACLPACLGGDAFNLIGEGGLEP